MIVLRPLVAAFLVCAVAPALSQQTRDLALGKPVTASSNAAIASTVTDGQAVANKNWSTSWTPPQNPARPSWLAIDLGASQELARLRVYFSVAAFGGIYDVWAPPNAMQVQVGTEVGSFTTVLAVGAASIPEHGACYAERMREFTLPPGTRGRHLRLLFPEGGKLKQLPDVASVSQVRVYGPAVPEAPGRTALLAGQFGEAVVDLDAPQVTQLRLRGPDGALAAGSLLAGSRRALRVDEVSKEATMWRRGAYTYVTDAAGRRFESVRSRAHSVELERGDNGPVHAVRFTGIVPTTAAGATGPVVESWTLRAGDSLIWEISQHWLRDTSVSLSGTPALYLARFGGVGAYRDGRIELTDPMVTSTIWVEPAQLLSGTHADYRTYPFPIVTEYLTHSLRVRDSWAIYKLFTNFHAAADLRLEPKGGHLYRRAAIRADFNEIGSAAQAQSAFSRRAGESSTLRLELRPVDKRETGEQLAVRIPDAALQGRLTDLFGSVLNGGAISDQRRFSFGNGSEDANYAGSSWMQAAALSVSTQAADPLAARPYSADRAFRQHLLRLLGKLDGQGRIVYGVNWKGLLLDDNLHVISAVRDHVVKTGDQSLAREAMPRLERMMGYFLARLDMKTGLFRSPGDGAHWYYDGIPFSGTSTYYQAFLYRALSDLAELADLLGQKQKAARLQAEAQKIAKAINDVLWYADAPGGPRYADWIDDKGTKHAHFVDIAQYPLIALGIAPPGRARQILDTADRRLAELSKRHGHTRSASLSMLWPLSPERGERCFGSYFYGGSLLAATYWEVVARARAGRVEGEWGALRLLQNFAKRYSETSFVGGNALDIRGNPSPGGDEGYLSDMLVVPAALVHGILGLRATWRELRAEPALPKGWDSAGVRVVWRGKMHDVAIVNDKAVIGKTK